MRANTVQPIIRRHLWHSWRESLLALMLVVVGDSAFRVVGRAFLFSPWATSGGMALAEELFWVTGHQPDVVLMGDSRIGDGLKPLTLENILSQQGMEADVVSIWLAAGGPVEGRQIVDHLLAEHSPKLVIFNLNENRLIDSPPRAKGLRWDEALLRQWPGYTALNDGLNWWLPHMVGTLRWGAFVKRASYNLVFDAARVALRGQSLPWGGLGQRRGYLPRYGRERSFRLEKRQAIDDELYAHYQTTEWATAQFDAFLATAQARHLRLVVVLMPVPPELFAKFPPERYAAFVRQVEEMTAAHGVPLVNYYQDNRLPPDSFFDYHHMNEVGAEAFSQELTREVVVPVLQDWERFKASHIP